MVEVVLAWGKSWEIFLSHDPSDMGTSNGRLLSPMLSPMIFTREDITRVPLALEGGILGVLIIINKNSVPSRTLVMRSQELDPAHFAAASSIYHPWEKNSDTVLREQYFGYRLLHIKNLSFPLERCPQPHLGPSKWVFIWKNSI